MKLQRNLALGLLIAAILLLLNEYRSNQQNKADLSAFTDSTRVQISEDGIVSRIINDADLLSNSRENAITRASRSVLPAVVGISVKSIKQVARPWSNDPFWRNFFPDVIRDEKVSGLGSGFIISQDGYVLTNDHVVEDAFEIKVTLPDGTRYDAKKVQSDFVTDIALLKIEGDNFPTVTLGNSDDIIIGEWAIALGNPFGLTELNNKPIVTVGVISAVSQNFGNLDNNRIYSNMIQTDAAINPGNSGGPLVNSRGEVIAMNSFIFTGSNTSEGSIGLGFAIPINKIKDIVKEIRETGKLVRPFYSGLKIQSITRGMARRFGLDANSAIIVTVENDSPGAKAGLRPYDIILEVMGKPVTSSDDVINYINETNPQPGKTIALTIFRNRRSYKANIVLGSPQ